MKLKEFIEKCSDAVPKGAVVNLEIHVKPGPKGEIHLDEGDDSDPVNKVTINFMAGFVAGKANCD